MKCFETMTLSLLNYERALVEWLIDLLATNNKITLSIISTYPHQRLLWEKKYISSILLMSYRVSICLLDELMGVQIFVLLFIVLLLSCCCWRLLRFCTHWQLLVSATQLISPAGKGKRSLHSLSSPFVRLPSLRRQSRESPYTESSEERSR